MKNQRNEPTEIRGQGALARAASSALGTAQLIRRRERTPSEDHLTAGDVAVQIVMLEACRFARDSKILDRAMHRVGAGSVRSALDPVGLNRGAEIDRKAVGPAMLLERTRPERRASQAQHHGRALVGVGPKELMLEAFQSNCTFGPRLARAFGREAANRSRQLAHQRFARAGFERDDGILFDSGDRAKFPGQEVAQIDRQPAAKTQPHRFEILGFLMRRADAARERPWRS